MLLIAAALTLTCSNLFGSWKAGREADRELSQLESAIGETHAADDDSGLEEREMPTITIDGYRYIGYISCPYLGLKLPVMDQWDYTRLDISPCRYHGTVYKNDLVIAGHNYITHFSHLRWLDIGTEIDFTDAEGNLYRYRLGSVEILKPDQVDDLIRDSKNWDMTLFTCTLGGRTRYTLRCVRITDDSAADKESTGCSE